MNELYRKIPKVDVLLEDKKIQDLCAQYGRTLVVDCIREKLEYLRKLAGNDGVAEFEDYLENFVINVMAVLAQESVYPLRKVCNATGIILHTNLGRAPLGKIHLDAISQAICSYSNLEYALETGKRGKRYTHYADLIAKVTGAESAIAVNNNAASLTLIFSALAKGKEVIVSRGESIEIGGRFRIPEVIEQSGAKLKEVGTTNRTRLSDYENAISEETGAILKVHTSNYKVVGFTEEASLEELSELGRKYNLPVITDLGSGVLIDLEKYGLAHEPTVQETLKKGADLVCFSGDKLLGGPQAGIIVGKEALIKAVEHHPMMRAIRLDKCIIAALMATFMEYQDEERAMKNIPILQMIARTPEELKMQAEKLCTELKKEEVLVEGKENCFCRITEAAVEPSISMIGGGSLPGEGQESFAVTITPKTMSCEEFAEKLRKFDVPVIAHIKNDKVWLDMRTVMEEDLEMIISELKTL